MATTNYSTIYELFLAGIQDYKIDYLFRDSVEDAEEYMKTFLIRGLINFDNCKKDLEDRDDELQKFFIQLNTRERVILSNLMIVEWLTKEVNDILQMKLHLQDHDFKTFSEAHNLREKQTYLSTFEERVDKQMNKYGYSNIDWDNL